MDSKKSAVGKGNSRLQGSGLFGITDKAIPTNHVGNTKIGFPVPLNPQARKLTMDAVLKAEYYKAQAITMIRRTSIR